MGNPRHVVASSLPRLSTVAAWDEMQVEGKAVRNQVALTFNCYGNHSGYKIVEPTGFFLPQRERIGREKEKLKLWRCNVKDTGKIRIPPWWH